MELNSLIQWTQDGGWFQWKDIMDSEIAQRAEDKLINDRVELIKEQLEQNRQIRQKAHAEIVKGFDSSAAAVSAFFKASQEERGLMQIEKVIEELSRKSTNDLKKELKELAERAGATEVVDGEEIENESDN